MRPFYLVVMALLFGCSENMSTSSRLQIVGGDAAIIEDFSFFTALVVETASGFKHFCSGSQIEPGAILTAAHCTNGFGKNENIFAAFHVQDFAKLEQDPNTILVRITDMTRHMDYLPSNYSTPDIALMFYDEKTVPLEISQARINLADQSSDQAASHKKATVIGHGSGSAFKKALVPPVDLKTCRAIPKYAYDRLNENFLCYGDMKQDNSAPCRGDSGGPLIYKQKGKEPVLLGITNWGGDPCGMAAEPTVYTRVSAFLDWIAMRVYLFKPQ